jgi:hypothetical protein
MPMLPKSLVIAVLSGVAASGALGAYFLNLEAQQYELKFVEGPAVSLTVEKRDHKLGEKVTIRMINSGTERITFLDNVPTLHIRALDGTVFYSTMIDSKGLESGEDLFFEWGQQKNDGSRVLEGRYVIAVTAYGPDGQKLDDRLTINILK